MLPLVPHPELLAHAKRYAQSVGQDYQPLPETGNLLDEKKASQVAEQYAANPHDPNNPSVRSAYDAFKSETVAQMKYLMGHGYTFTPVSGNEAEDAETIIHGVRNQKHIPFFTGGDLPADHPLAAMTDIKIGDHQLSYNEAFRAVHDVFGHALHGNKFGPTGEEHAFQSHAKMYSQQALPAMTNETKGQNSWLHFGPHKKETPADRPFAPQKANLIKLSRKIRLAKRVKNFDPEGVPEYMPKVDTNSANLPPETGKIKAKSYTDRPIPELVHEPDELRSIMIDRLSTKGISPPTNPRDPLGELTANHPKAPPELKKLDRVAGEIHDALRQGQSIEQAIKSRKLSKEEGDSLRLAGFVLGGTDHASYFLASEKDSGKQWYTNQLEKYVDGIRRVAQEKWGFSPETFGLPGSGFGKKMTPAMKMYMALTAVTSAGANPIMNSGLAYRIFDSAVEDAKRHGRHPIDAFHNYPMTQADGKAWTMMGENTRSSLTYLRNLTLPRGGENQEQALQRAAKFLDSDHHPSEIHQYKTWLHNRPGTTVRANTPFGQDMAHPGSYIFGPKLGAFYQNLTGNLNHLTADMWWSRTWGRLVGRMFSHAKGKMTLKKSPQENEREVMDRSARVAAKSLNMTVADFQAVLWYYEKALYEKMGAPAERVSYEKGIEHVLNQAGLGKEEDLPLFRPNASQGQPASGLRPDAKPGQGTSGHPRLSRLGTLLRKARTVAFSSPNVEQLDFGQALNRLHSDNHRQFRESAAQLLNRLQVKGKIEDAIGDWEDGAENSLVHDLNVPSHDLSRYIAAWLGRIGKQKAVLHFIPDKAGKDFLHETTVPQTDLASLRGQLSQLGIQFRTLVPQPEGTKVLLFDEGGQLKDRFVQFARANRGQVQQLSGTGEFIGGPDRAAASEKYRQIIGDYESAHGQAAGGAGAAGNNPAGPSQAPAGGAVSRGIYYRGGAQMPSGGV